MGKNKNSPQNERIRQIRRERAMAEKKAARAKTAKRTVIISVAVALAVAAVITVIALAVGSYKKTNKYKTGVTVLSTENFNVDLAMYTYYFFDGYYGMIDMYGDQLKENGTYPDITKDLDEQYYGDRSWREFFTDSAVNQISMNLILAEAAKADGITLSEKELQMLDIRAERVDVSKYGEGITKEDILNCYKLDYLAIKYEYEKRLSFRREGKELEEYYNKYYKSFSTIDFRCLEVPYGTNGLTSAQAEGYARAIAAATNSSEFTQAIRDNVLNINPALTADQVEQIITSSTVEKASYSEGDIVTEWLFSEDRKPNETYVYHNEATQSHTAYMIIKSPEKDMYDTATFRHILFRPDTYGSDEAALAKAQEILGLWENNGKSEAEFAEYAIAYSEDASTSYLGGIFENTTAESLESYLPEIKEWCFSDEVKAGDCEIIKTKFGYNLILYVKDGLPSALGRTQNQTTKEDFETLYTQFQEKYAININENAILGFDSDISA